MTAGSSTSSTTTRTRSSKVRTRDMAVVQTVATNEHPIGITFDAATHAIWVACYSGSIEVFKGA